MNDSIQFDALAGNGIVSNGNHGTHNAEDYTNVDFQCMPLPENFGEDTNNLIRNGYRIFMRCAMGPTFKQNVRL